MASQDLDCGPAKRQKMDDATTCYICTEVYTDPKALPCLHVLCMKCIQQIGFKTNKGSGDEMPCPICRQLFQIPTEGFLGLPTHFFNESLIQLSNGLHVDHSTSAISISDASAEENQGASTCELRRKSKPVLVQIMRTNAAKQENKAIVGLTTLDKELFVLSGESSEVEVYNSMKLSFSRRWKLNQLIDPMDIASCNINKCLYIIDFKGYGKLKEILRVGPNGNLIKNWSTGSDYGEGLSVTFDANVILAVCNENKLNEYSPSGQLIREIKLLSGPGIRYPLHATKLTNGQYLVSHGIDVDELHRLCVVDVDGELKKSFGGKCGLSTNSYKQMNLPIYLSVDKNGFVMVADTYNHRVLLLDSDLKFIREIVSEEKGYELRNLRRILPDDSNGRLVVTDNTWDSKKNTCRDGRILIYNYSK